MHKLHFRTSKVSAASSIHPTDPLLHCFQADIDAGEISDASSVVSSSPAPSSAEVAAEASCTVALPRQPGIEILKVVTDSTAANGVDPLITDAGDTFDYRITVSNTGNTWLGDVVVSDTMLGEDGYALGCISSYTGNFSRLSPGESFECTTTLTLEQVHIDGQCVENTANVRWVKSDASKWYSSRITDRLTLSNTC